MFREFVTVQDAIVAVTCVECSMQNSALLGSMNALHTRFPDDPQEEYTRQATLVLKRLNLEDMVSVINEVPANENDGSHPDDRGNDLEDNSRTTNECLLNNNAAKELLVNGEVTGQSLRNREKRRQNSSTDDESDKSFINERANSVSSDSDELNSLCQLTGVFPIESSSGIGTQGFVDKESSRLLPGPSTCDTTSRQQERKGIENLENSEGDKTPNESDSSKPSCFPASSLRSIASTRGENTLNTKNRKAVASPSLETSKKMIEMFAKKPLNAVGRSGNGNNCQRPRVEGSRIFVTEELDDDQLEVEWPSGMLSSLQTDSNLAHSVGFLRGRDRTS